MLIITLNWPALIVGLLLAAYILCYKINFALNEGNRFAVVQGDGLQLQKRVKIKASMIKSRRVTAQLNLIFSKIQSNFIYANHCVLSSLSLSDSPSSLQLII
jgi:hypothetical protein